MVRNRAVDLMLHAGGMHAQHVWEGLRPVPASHALMFLYVDLRAVADPRAVKADRVVFVAPRFQVAGPEADDLVGVLDGVTRNALRMRVTERGFDVRTHLATNPGRMPDGVVYAGVAASTLDTPAGPFARARQVAANAWEAPSRCFVELFDGTRILIDRNPADRQSRAVIRSTRTLDGAGGYTSRQWVSVSAAGLVGEPQTRSVWWLLHLLHLTVAGPEGLADER
ncbi:hypothetical protein [Phytohabitans flavus]|uniref:hypothetical protein n=1 Tax=Phytohabitans flavus TaxID=1076124 RepID=UPI0015637EA6|nr:hypothetical protein [Phytohabitans flavus]